MFSWRLRVDEKWFIILSGPDRGPRLHSGGVGGVDEMFWRLGCLSRRFTNSSLSTSGTATSDGDLDPASKAAGPGMPKSPSNLDVPS